MSAILHGQETYCTTITHNVWGDLTSDLKKNLNGFTLGYFDSDSVFLIMKIISFRSKCTDVLAENLWCYYVLPIYPKYCAGYPEESLFLCTKNLFLGLKYPK